MSKEGRRRRNDGRSNLMRRRGKGRRRTTKDVMIVEDIRSFTMSEAWRRRPFLTDERNRRLRELDELKGKIIPPTDKKNLTTKQIGLEKGWADGFTKGDMDFDAAWRAIRLIVETQLLKSLYVASPSLLNSQFFRPWNVWVSLVSRSDWKVTPMGHIRSLCKKLIPSTVHGKMNHTSPSTFLHRSPDEGLWTAEIRHEPKDGLPPVQISLSIMGPLRGIAVDPISTLDYAIVDWDSLSKGRGQIADISIVHNAISVACLKLELRVGDRSQSLTLQNTIIGARFLRYPIPPLVNRIGRPKEEIHSSRRLWPCGIGQISWPPRSSMDPFFDDSASDTDDNLDLSNSTTSTFTSSLPSSFLSSPNQPSHNQSAPPFDHINSPTPHSAKTF